MQSNCVQNTPELDLIWSAEGIATAIKRTTRETYALLERGHLPARKIGKQWVASRQALVEYFNASVAA